MAERLQVGERDRPLRQTLVHERKVVLQDGAIVVPPLRRHRRCVETIQRGLHPAPVRQHRAAPRLIAGIVHVGPDHLGQRHRAVADRFQKLVGDRHLRRLERRHAGTIEDEAAARAREEAEDDRMPGKNVRPEHLARVTVQLEHGCIERHHVPVCGIDGAGLNGARDRLHVIRKSLSVSDSDCARHCHRCRGRIGKAFQRRCQIAWMPPGTSMHCHRKIPDE